MMKHADTALISGLLGVLGAVWPSPADAQQSFPPYKPTTNEIRAQSKLTTEDRLERLEKQVTSIEGILAEQFNLAGKDTAQPPYPGTGVASAEPPANTVPVYGGQYHVIQEGETLQSIAQKYGVPLDELLAVNKVDRYGVAPLSGQKLWVPVANPPSKPQKTVAAKAPSTVTRTAEWTASYQVKPGDTLYSIARRSGVTAVEIAERNRLKKVDQIVVGQVLVLPGGQTPTSVSHPETPPQNLAAAQAQPEETYHYYKVMAGDTLSEISQTFFTTEDELKRINQLSGSQLQVGQQIIVPTRLYLENEKKQQPEQPKQPPVS